MLKGSGWWLGKGEVEVEGDFVREVKGCGVRDE